jgi:ATPases with chaperone activity, ATP-binding subunit
MAEKKYDAWLEQFEREIGIKSSVIVCGNTNDLVFNAYKNGIHDSVVNTLIDSAKAKGYSKVIKWDRVDGIDTDTSDEITVFPSQERSGAQNVYDFGDDDLSSESNEHTYRDPGEFFPYMLNLLPDSQNRNSNQHVAFILDYSDYLFGNANSLSEQERQYLATLGKTLEKTRRYDTIQSEVQNIVIIVTRNLAMFPPAFYLHNPLVTTVNVSLPGRNERERFIDANIAHLKCSQNITSDPVVKSDFIDALDGFSLKELSQLITLSRQMEGELLSFEKLINLYKYGEKVSPWEELSREKLQDIESRLTCRVKGQEEAIRKVKDVIIRAYTGFSGLQHSAKQKKPKGTLFFVGPTGVGKTELAKSLAEFIFGDENACIRFDMSEYNHEHSDQRLVGAPPGYVGYETGGQLTNAVKEKPFCVLLFDEIEKAHGRILDKFLQILEDGRLTDGKGETVYFSESIIIFTSNIGADSVVPDDNADPKADKKRIRKEFTDKVKTHFKDTLGRPELLNRIGDNIVPFNFISNPDVFTSIARVKFESIKTFVKERYHASLDFEDEKEAFEAIGRNTRRENGGRGLLNLMETEIINPMSEFIFNNIEILAQRTIVIKLMFPDNPNYCKFDFELK